MLIPHVLATPSNRFLPQGPAVSGSACLLCQTRPSSPGLGMRYRLTLYIATVQPFLAGHSIGWPVSVYSSIACSATVGPLFCGHSIGWPVTVV